MKKFNYEKKTYDKYERKRKAFKIAPEGIFFQSLNHTADSEVSAYC